MFPLKRRRSLKKFRSRMNNSRFILHSIKLRKNNQVKLSKKIGKLNFKKARATNRNLRKE